MVIVTIVITLITIQSNVGVQNGKTGTNVLTLRHSMEAQMKRKLRYDTFGERLRSARLSEKLSRRELAEKTHCCTYTIEGYERDGINPSLFITADIAKVLGVTIDYLVYGKE